MILLGLSESKDLRRFKERIRNSRHVLACFVHHDFHRRSRVLFPVDGADDRIVKGVEGYVNRAQRKSSFPPVLLLDSELAIADSQHLKRKGATFLETAPGEGRVSERLRAEARRIVPDLTTYEPREQSMILYQVLLQELEVRRLIVGGMHIEDNREEHE